MKLEDREDALLEELRFCDINGNILNAMKKIKRYLFVLKEYKEKAYENIALPLSHGSTISQPYTVAIMLQNLELKKGLKVLEVGTGSGWNSALIGYLIGSKGRVYTTEIIKEMVEFSKKNIKKVGIKNVKVFYGDILKKDLFKVKKFNRIIITAAAFKIPEKLINMLENNGILLCPVGKEIQNLIKIRKKGKKLIKESLGEFIFVRLKE